MTSSNINDAVLMYSFLFGFDYFLFVFVREGPITHLNFLYIWQKENLVNNLENKNLLVSHFRHDITPPVPFPLPVKDKL